MNRAMILCWAVGLVFLSASCQPAHTPSRQIFDEAEEAYRSGQYDLAHRRYEQFLKQNLDSQLARLSERRMLSIEREIESVMNIKSGPRPVYANPQDSSTQAPTQEPHIFLGREPL